MPEQPSALHELLEMADLTRPLAIRTAATLRLADHVAAGADGAASLARAADADADALRRLMNYLVAVGVFAEEPDGRYRLTELSDRLRDTHPDQTRSALDMDGGHGRADLCFVDLARAVRTGKATYAVRYGRPLWQDLSANPAWSESFDASMALKTAHAAPAIAAAYDWSLLRHLVDVGGGNGELLIALLKAHPTLTGTLFEQPLPAGAAAVRLARAGLGGRAEVIAGSFFDPLPIGDGYLLYDILHDWNDEDATRILHRCAEAAGETGPILVIEPTDLTDPFIAMVDLRMLVFFGGRQRDIHQIADLAAPTGLMITSVRQAGRLSVIEFHRAGGHA
ncbi:methyltransferase [Nonomuraea sp. WAC 01424]|uniref:methyltransferase n=1 Tax=Nonomuraea sp. WAC 01424 TaxID=2203200 RepID=UPI0021AD62AD|nr:methyltransferase [Nonomuraea sp. WAC 01424]